MNTVKMMGLMDINSLESLFSSLERREIAVKNLIVNTGFMEVIKKYIDADPKPYPDKYAKLWGANIAITDNINGAIAQNLEKNEQALLELSLPS